MNLFDVRIHAIRHRRNRRRPFEVRWHAADRGRSKSFITRRLADSYRAELVRAARKGLEFDPVTGEPVLWAAPQPAATTWYLCVPRISSAAVTSRVALLAVRSR